MGILWPCDVHTIYILFIRRLKAEVLEHPFPPEMSADLICANTIIYEISKFCMVIIFPFYNISTSNIAVILILARCFQL